MAMSRHHMTSHDYVTLSHDLLHRYLQDLNYVEGSQLAIYGSVSLHIVCYCYFCINACMIYAPPLSPWQPVIRWLHGRDGGQQWQWRLLSSHLPVPSHRLVLLWWAPPAPLSPSLTPLSLSVPPSLLLSFHHPIVYLTSPEPLKNCRNFFILHPNLKTLPPLESTHLSRSDDILYYT